MRTIVLGIVFCGLAAAQSFMATGNMNQSLAWHTATLLAEKVRLNYLSCSSRSRSQFDRLRRFI